MIADTHSVLAGDVLPLRLCQGYGLELVPAVNPHNGYLNTESASVRPPATAKTQQHHQADATCRRQKLEQEASISDLTHVTFDQLMPHSAPHADSFPSGAPSLVGATYMGVQGAQQISVGATKQFGLSPEEALQECGRGVTDPEEVAQAEGLLRPKAEGLWSPAASWQVNPSAGSWNPCVDSRTQIYGQLAFNLLRSSCAPQGLAGHAEPNLKAMKLSHELFMSCTRVVTYDISHNSMLSGCAEPV